MKEVYLVHVDEYIGALIPNKHKIISYAPQEKFIDFVKSLREDFPEYKPRCILNEGISEYIRKKINSDKILLNQKNRGR